MSTEKRIYKPKSIAGFPEWLPEERLVEQKWFDHIRRIFESYGFCSIETPSVEELDVLTAKGEVDKEIYVIERLHKDENDKKEARLALHFDQTVPMARYVAMHFNELVFPFKRYQMQRVWRGERPQMGRMREFYQCDIDIINVDSLPISFDAEVAAVVYEVLEGLNIGRVQIRINNRKILMGLLESWGLQDYVPVTRAVDKFEKIGKDAVIKLLADEAKLSVEQIDKVLSLVSIKGKAEDIRAIIPANDTMKAGIEELSFVLDNLKHLPSYAVVGDLSIVRGLDYYTGTVYETQLLDVPEFTGSVCSGGRYDDLAGSYINKHLPGVGISIGFSRLFDVMLQMRPDLLGIGPKSPAHVMMIMPSEDERGHANATARTLREKGYNVEMYHAARKIPDQLKYASKKLIPYVWFPFKDGHQVKNMASGEQISADPKTWNIQTQ
ncbi:MAG TPA: histidine--tRNA ligase [Micavibrio sp.]|nr:histidine--tRNA ligase [Micavibrio sp.]